MYERIKELCKLKGTNINALEKELGFSKGSLCKIDKNKPSGEKLQKIADYFETTINYLTTGEEISPDYILKLGESDANFLIEYHKLSESNRKQVERMVKYYIELQKAYKEKDGD